MLCGFAEPKYRTKIDLIGDRRRGLWSQRAEGWLYPMMLSAVSRRESHESQLSNRQFSIKNQNFFPVLSKFFFVLLKLCGAKFSKKGQRDGLKQHESDFGILFMSCRQFLRCSSRWPFFMFGRSLTENKNEITIRGLQKSTVSDVVCATIKEKNSRFAQDFCLLTPLWIEFKSPFGKWAHLMPTTTSCADREETQT